MTVTLRFTADVDWLTLGPFAAIVATDDTIYEDTIDGRELAAWAYTEGGEQGWCVPQPGGERGLFSGVTITSAAQGGEPPPGCARCNVLGLDGCGLCGRAAASPDPPDDGKRCGAVPPAACHCGRCYLDTPEATP